MEHNIIETTTVENSFKTQMLLQQENNLDKKDNLDELPTSPAVFAICGRVNGKPANPRYVNISNNLRETVKLLFDKDDTSLNVSDCVKSFVLSIKIKTIIYQDINDLIEQQREEIKMEWERKYKPECNEQLNEIH